MTALNYAEAGTGNLDDSAVHGSEIWLIIGSMLPSYPSRDHIREPLSDSRILHLKEIEKLLLQSPNRAMTFQAEMAE
jgi:hypothetical protein